MGGLSAGAEPPRAVLIDVLGTLVELDSPAQRLQAELRERAGLEVSEQAAAEAIGAEIAFYLAHQLEGRDEASLALLRERCADVLRAALPGGDAIELDIARALLLSALHVRPFADAAPALRELRARGLGLVAVSNWDCSLPDYLARAGLLELLDGAVSSAVVGATKPDGAVFGAALELAGAGPGEVLHVGDSPDADVRGARAAGIDAILLVRSGTPPADVDAPVITSLIELPDLIFARP